MKRKETPQETMTPQEFADEKGVAYTTVMTWLGKGIVPGAEKVDYPRGAVWEIPRSVAATFTPPPMGRPKKAAAETETKPAAKKRASKKAGN